MAPTHWSFYVDFRLFEKKLEEQLGGSQTGYSSIRLPLPKGRQWFIVLYDIAFHYPAQSHWHCELRLKSKPIGDHRNFGRNRNVNLSSISVMELPFSAKFRPKPVLHTVPNVSRNICKYLRVDTREWEVSLRVNSALFKYSWLHVLW